MHLFGEGPWDVGAQHLPILRTCSFGPFSRQCREVILWKEDTQHGQVQLLQRRILSLDSAQIPSL